MYQFPDHGFLARLPGHVSAGGIGTKHHQKVVGYHHDTHATSHTWSYFATQIAIIALRVHQQGFQKYKLWKIFFMSRRILRISTSEFPYNLQTLNKAFLPQQRTPLEIGRLNCVGPVQVTKSLGKAYMLKKQHFCVRSIVVPKVLQRWMETMGCPLWTWHSSSLTQECKVLSPHDFRAKMLTLLSPNDMYVAQSIFYLSLRTPKN